MESAPFFSVIVPTYGRSRSLLNCLEAIANQTYPSDRFEVLVVNDGGSTPTGLTTFQTRLNLSLIHQSHAGPAAARNTGSRHAAGEYLAFTDDDCAPAPDWLAQLSAQFAHTPDDAIGGRTLNTLPKNIYSTTTQVLVDYLYEVHNTAVVRFLASNNLAIPAKPFRALGGFNPAFTLAAGEDWEFCDRWRGNGYKLAFVPQAAVYHAHPLTLTSFWWQHFTYGCGAFQVRRLRSQRTGQRMRLETFSFYGDLLGYPLKNRREGNGRSLLICLLLLKAQLASLSGFFWQSYKG